jgi:hypothetical protein
MDTRFANKIMDEREVISDEPEIGDGVAEFLSALAVGLKVPDGFHPWPEPVLECFDMFTEVRLFTVVFDKVRFEVEEIQVTGGASHEQLDNTFCSWPMVRERISGAASGFRSGEQPLAAEETAQRDAAQAAP